MKDNTSPIIDQRTHKNVDNNNHQTKQRKSFSIYTTLKSRGIFILLLCMLISSVFSFFATTHEVDELFDASLIENTFVIKSLIDHPAENKSWQNFENLLTETNLQYGRLPLKLSRGFAYQKKLAIQIWTQHGELVVASTSSPKIALSPLQPGFSTLRTQNFTWYVSTVWLAHNNHWLMVAERSDIRNELAWNIAACMFISMLICLCLAYCLIHQFLRKSLKPLEQLKQNIVTRNNINLTPITLTSTPSELKPVVDALNILFNQVENVRQREQQFITDTAHELRTPLTVIKLLAQQAIVAPVPEQAEYINKILIGVDRSQRIIEQLLMMARTQAGDRDIQNMVFRLDLLAQETIAQLVPLALSKYIELELEADPVFIKGDEFLCTALIRNILDNAIKNATPNTTVKTSIQSYNSRVILTITNTGACLSEEQIKRLTERFWQAKSADQSGGLGLAIVANIAKLHHAHLSISNLEKNKIAFSVSFPIQNEIKS